MNMLILSRIESILSRIEPIFNTDKANQELYRENYFSEEFLINALQDVGFKSVEVLAPTEEGAISLNAKLFDERGNSFTISVHHLGNVINFSARPNNIYGTQVPKNINYISVTDIYLPKYIKSEVAEGLVFGNETQTNLLRECKRKAISFFQELKDEFERRRRRFTR